MAKGNYCGPTGLSTNNPLVDAETSCRDMTWSPLLVGMNTPLPASKCMVQTILAGKSAREPGLSLDGTQAEDMMYADKPSKSASIEKDPMFAHNDATLSAYLRQLMESLSIGKMETVALEMQSKFSKGEGGTYHSSVLDDEIRNNAAFLTYHAGFVRELIPAIKKCSYDVRNLKPITMTLLAFTSFWDKVGGLGITVHQVWSARADIEAYAVDCVMRTWSCSLNYTFYDHYGLDWEDILKHGGDRFPQYHTGDCFKAWYILQHYRSARPFITVMNRRAALAGRLG